MLSVSEASGLPRQKGQILRFAQNDKRVTACILWTTVHQRH